MITSVEASLSPLAARIDEASNAGTPASGWRGTRGRMAAAAHVARSASGLPDRGSKTLGTIEGRRAAMTSVEARAAQRSMAGCPQLGGLSSPFRGVGSRHCPVASSALAIVVDL